MWPKPVAEAGFFTTAQGHKRRGAQEVARHTGDASSTSFEDSSGAGALAKKKAEIQLKVKELDRQIELQRSSERALADQEEDQEKAMGDTAVLTPAQEEAGLKAREISKQESQVVEKTEQLVKEKLDLLKELQKLEEQEAKGKEVEPGETITKEIVGPAGEKEVEVVKEEEGGKEEVMEVRQETPEEAQEIQQAGGEVISPPPPSPGFPEQIECPPCSPLPKARERPLMISAEDEPPGKAPQVEVNVTESYQPYVPQPSLLFAPPAPVKKMRFRMPEMPQVMEQGTAAGDDQVEWQLPKHVPGPSIGSESPSLSGALMDSEVTDENEVPEEYDEVPEEIHEALRGGHSFKKPMEEMMPWFAALLKPRNWRQCRQLANFL